MNGRQTAYVSDPLFGAKGDGISNDRAAIQRAVDAVYSAGGGDVVLSAGKTYLSGGIILRDNVTLFFEDGAVLLQSPDPDDYVKPAGDGYEPYRPEYGHNYSSVIRWSHLWYRNYPLIFAPESTHDFAVKGRGTVRMMEITDPGKILKICPIGFYRCDRFEISGIRITNYHSYAMMPFTSTNGLIRDVTIDGSCHGNGDGVCLMNCQHIRITGCRMSTGDDSVYIFSSCRDPRRSEWWSSDDPRPSYDIEIDHNDLVSDHCKAFGMILWGLTCEDPEKVEVRHVRVHDNHFETMGNWLYCPYTDRAGVPPVTDVRFENNVIDGIEANFFETEISDVNFYPAASRMYNGGFEHGRCFWSLTEGSARVCREPEKQDPPEKNPFGIIENFSAGRAAIYQGLRIDSGRPYLFRAEVKTSGCVCRMFVRDLDTGALAASLDFSSPDWEEKQLSFTVPKSGNYHVGIENGDADEGEAYIRNAAFSGGSVPPGYETVISDCGKIIYKYSDNLFKR